MEELKPYKVGFAGLSNGRHRFVFEIGPAFFECFEHSEIVQGLLNLDLELFKEENMLVLEFGFTGWIELFCDRCLEAYHEQFESMETLYVKFGEDHYEQSEDVVVIPSTDSHFDIAQYVYEFIHLRLPLKRVHPDDAAGNSGCNRDMIERAEKLSPGSKKRPLEGSPFEVLKGLRFNKKN